MDVTATANSLASQTIFINDTAVEDLLVFTTGSGARLVNGVYDQIATESDAYIAAALDRGGLTIKAVSDDSLRYEILDKNTGHSIATRTVDENNIFTFDNYKIQLKGKSAFNDQFSIERAESGAVILGT